VEEPLSEKTGTRGERRRCPGPDQFLNGLAKKNVSMPENDAWGGTDGVTGL